MREYTKDGEQAGLPVRNVGNAVIKLKELTSEEDKYPLAVLVTEITDNPHYLGRGTIAGLLFIHAICCRENMELPEDAHRWRKMLTQVSTIPDNISSMAHGYGLRLFTKQGWHGAYDTFCERKGPYIVIMENMKGITGIRAVGEEAYIAENKIVFSYLIRNLKGSDYALLCTSGQPHSMAQMLITYILTSRSKIYYNGDIDPDRVCIADRLWKKFRDRIHIWRMSPKDYDRSLSKERIRDIGRAKLENIDHPVLKRMVEYMKEKQLAGCQENMLKELLEDMQN